MKRDRRRGPLSAEQQRLVQENLGLVGLHLKRRLPGDKGGAERGERPDLYQEGCLGLMQAAQDYDPGSGIPFAAYALRRIHRAIGYALNRRFSLVRVPACELRRARSEKRMRVRGAPFERGANHGPPERAGRSHRAVGPRTIVSAASIDHLHNLAWAAPVPADGLPTIEERLRERYLHAVSDAAEALAGDPSRMRARAHQHVRMGYRGGSSRAQLTVACDDKDATAGKLVRKYPARGIGAERGAMIETIVAERLMVSSPAWQMPLRQIAERLGCGYPAVAACERRLMKEVEQRLRRDENLATLLRCAAKSPLGRRQPIDEGIERELRDTSATQFMRLLAEADDRARSEILRKLLEIAGEALHPAICRTVSALPDHVRDQFLAQARASAAPQHKESRRQLTRRCA